jgi:hypothetical protein
MKPIYCSCDDSYYTKDLKNPNLTSCNRGKGKLPSKVGDSCPKEKIREDE